MKSGNSTCPCAPSPRRITSRDAVVLKPLPAFLPHCQIGKTTFVQTLDTKSMQGINIDQPHTFVIRPGASATNSFATRNGNCRNNDNNNRNFCGRRDGDGYPASYKEHRPAGISRDNWTSQDICIHAKVVASVPNRIPTAEPSQLAVIRPMPSLSSDTVLSLGLLAPWVFRGFRARAVRRAGFRVSRAPAREGK